MVKEEKTPGNIPPYVSYKTFKGFIEPFKITTPGRIDRSIMKSYSGGQQNQLMMALKSLRLIDNSSGTPTEALLRLVRSEGQERQKSLKDILSSSYPFLFTEGVDLQKDTQQQLEERFRSTGIAGDTIRKCVAFFLSAAKDAGLPLSPYFKATKTRTSAPRTRRNNTLATGTQMTTAPTATPDQSNTMGWSALLLSKFPSFDPAWPDDVKKEWFKAFRDLRQSGPQDQIEDEE